MEVSDQHHALTALTSGKNPGTHRIGGCVGRRFDVDIFEIRTFLLLPEVEPPDRPARSLLAILTEPSPATGWKNWIWLLLLCPRSVTTCCMTYVESCTVCVCVSVWNPWGSVLNFNLKALSTGRWSRWCNSSSYNLASNAHMSRIVFGITCILSLCVTIYFG
jgi:hypothetical protein